MSRDIVKVRKVGETLVITLTQTVLAAVELAEGDRVLLEPTTANRVIVSKERPAMSNTQRTELELDVLQHKKNALESELEWVTTQHNLNMPCDPGLQDEDVRELAMRELALKVNRLQADIAEKRLELFDLQGH